jgi:adenylosuccinate synthase
MQRGLLNVVIDGQFGSTGKGKIAAYLACKHNIDAAICNNMSNAGHTFYVDGRKYVAYHLPAAAANRRTKLYIGPTAAITVKMLIEELEAFSDLNVADRLFIHPRAVIITDECKQWEKENLVRISSTTKGCGRAMAMKVMRHPDTVLAGDVLELADFVIDEDVWRSEILALLAQGATVLAESAQGFGLSLNHGRMYPYCTSRDITVAQVLSDCGVPPRKLGHVYASMRCHPIRVGNVKKDDGEMVGFSGPVFDDQRELTWEDITRISGSALPISERTTVTNKVRRVFTWSDQQVAWFNALCEPDFIFLNFVNYLDAGILNKDSSVDLHEYPRVYDFMLRLQGKFHVPVAYLGTGPEEKAIIDCCCDPVELAAVGRL